MSIQIIDENRPRSFAERLLSGAQQAATSAATGIPALIGKRMQQQQENAALQRLTGKDLSGLSPELKAQFASRLAKTPGHDAIVKALVDKGVNPQDAELYAHLTTGGQTEFIKNLLESQKRQGKIVGGPQFSPQSEEESFASPEEAAENKFQQILQSQDTGLTPAERVKREQERYSTGLKVYQEGGSKLRGLSREKERLNILEKLNSSKKLPENFGRLNVNKEGNLRFPFASSPEAQRFVKTLNEFSANAKDTFGSRVTNFDLQQFMLRYPNLLNTTEGRKQLIQQMKIVNDINSIYYKNLKDVYDKAGGVRKIDSDVAERLAEEKSEGKIAELTKKFEEIGQFPSLPNPSEFKGRKIRNSETGEIMISDGTQWVPGGS